MMHNTLYRLMCPVVHENRAVIHRLPASVLKTISEL